MGLKHGAQRTGRRDDDAIKQWRSHRLGQFVHFGLYSIPAGTWDGVEYDYAAEFLPKSANVPSSKWAELADQFTLPHFSANEWADATVASGAGYVVITTKHHEGFCLWPSVHTAFNISTTPFGRTGRDLLGELVAAYTKRGIDVILYYSVLDWHHPDWRYTEPTADDKAASVKYRAFALAQILELCERYPVVRGFWFDGTWDDSVRGHGHWTHEVEDAIKTAIPHALVNSRLRADEHGSRHFDSEGHLMGDYESGYERRLPDAWDTVVTTRDWEACMTIPEHTWGYHAGEWASKSRRDWRDVIDQLAHAVSRGGNFLLNVGPRGDGAHNPDDLAVTTRVGAWVDRHKDAIRSAGTEARLTPPSWGFFTLGSDGRTHAIVTRIPTSMRVRIAVPPQFQLDVVRSPEGLAFTTVVVSPTTMEFRLEEHPDSPFTISFVLADANVERVHDVNPDVVN